MSVLRSQRLRALWTNYINSSVAPAIFYVNGLAMSHKSKIASGPSQRQLRVGESLRQHLANILLRQETHIPELDIYPITVSEVSVSPDLGNARIYVMTLGGNDLDRVLPILNQYAPVLRNQVAQKIQLRRVPTFKFVSDDSFETADRMARIFANIKTTD